MRTCPKCGSPRVLRSRSRNVWERLRKVFTEKRPHRCHACGWRGWGPETTYGVPPEQVAAGARQPELDLAAIDITVPRPDSGDASRGKPRTSAQ